MVNSTILMPNSRKVRRKNELGKERSPVGTNDSTTEFSWTTTKESKTESGTNKFSLRWKSWNWSNFQSFTLVCLGAVLALSYFYYVTTMFETVTRFSHLSNLERELSLPTDVAFRYAFYKKIANADSYVEGLRSVIYDTNTDWPRSTNSFQKHSLTPEAVLGAGFHLLKKFQEWTNLKLSNCWLSRHRESVTGGNGDEAFSCVGPGDTLHFYLYAFWAVESAIVSLLLYFGLMLSNSVVGGITTSLLFVVAHPQRSNYEWIFPLQEKTGWAAALLQIFILSRCVLKKRNPSWTGCVKIAISTTILFLSWKTEAQWILVSQLIIISLLHFSNLISRYTASLVIFGQLTGWQYASLISFDVTFIHWSFFLYVLMTAIITIFLIEPILDWVFGDKIEKWVFLRATILLISFQMILICVRCDFGRMVGFKEDNRFLLSFGVTEIHEVKGINEEFKLPLVKEKGFGLLPTASAEILYDLHRYKKEKHKMKHLEKDLYGLHEEIYDFHKSAASIDSTEKISAIFKTNLKNTQSQVHKVKVQNNYQEKLKLLDLKFDEMYIEDKINEKKAFQEVELDLEESNEAKVEYTANILLQEERKLDKKEENDEISISSESENLLQEKDDMKSKFAKFFCQCFGAPLKFSLKIFFTKYILLLLGVVYVVVTGVFLPAFICSRKENAEREKMKKMRNEQKRINGKCPLGLTVSYDLTTFYNCYYRFMAVNENSSFAKTLGFSVKDDRDTIVRYYFHPAVFYNTCQLVFFAISCCFLDKHWELLFVTQVCLLFSLLGDYKRISTVFGKLSWGYGLGTNIHWFAVFGIISIIFASSRIGFQKMYQNSRGISETSNPKTADLVEAVKWIRMNSGRNSSFAGVENLMTIVYLSTQRPCVNHHHSGHLLTPETIEMNGVPRRKMTFSQEFPQPAVSNGIRNGKVTMRQSKRSGKKVPFDGFEKSETVIETYSNIKKVDFIENKVDMKEEIEVTTSNSHSRLPLFTADSDFDEREKESLYKVYSMFNRRKSISEFHDGLLSLNVSYLFLSCELCSPPAASVSSMFFDNESSKTEKHKSFSYAMWTWEDLRVDKEYAHWQQIGKSCDVVSFWDSIKKRNHKENKVNGGTTSSQRTEILCFTLMNDRNIKPFTRVFENGFYTILATSP